jgi:hypothetical protein
MSHTPGPWCVRDIPSKERYVGPSSDGGAPSVAIIPARASRSDAEQAANARLIAAAPELLEVLSIALELLHNVAPCTGQEDILSGCVDAARAAIAKATGEQL